MRSVGYSPKTAENPSKLTKSEGFKQLLHSYGLTEELVTKSLVDDIKHKKRNRKPELELAYKVLGRLEAKSSGITAIQVNFDKIRDVMSDE